MALAVPTEVADALTAWMAAGAQPVTVGLEFERITDGAVSLYCLSQLARMLAPPMAGVDIDRIHRVRGEGC